MKGAFFVATNNSCAKTGTEIGFGESLHFWFIIPDIIQLFKLQALQEAFFLFAVHLLQPWDLILSPNCCYTHLAAVDLGAQIPTNMAYEDG